MINSVGCYALKVLDGVLVTIFAEPTDIVKHKMNESGISHIM